MSAVIISHILQLVMISTSSSLTNRHIASLTFNFNTPSIKPISNIKYFNKLAAGEVSSQQVLVAQMEDLSDTKYLHIALVRWCWCQDKNSAEDARWFGQMTAIAPRQMHDWSDWPLLGVVLRPPRWPHKNFGSIYQIESESNTIPWLLLRYSSP